MSKKDKSKDSLSQQNTHSHDTRETSAIGDIELQQLHDQIQREKVEPQELSAPIPLFFLVLCAVLVFWAGFYFARYSGGFSPNVFNPEAAVTAEVTKTEVAFNPIAHGKKIFSRTCVQCHQTNGQGLPGVFPPLDGSPWLNGTPERPASILLLGLQGPLNVHGTEYNGNMPSHSMLSDKDIASVLTFARQSWGNESPAVEEELVAEVRKGLGDRKTAWTAPELLKLYPLENEH